MEAQAKLKNARVSAQKARLVADTVRGLAVGRALELLEFNNKKAAKFLKNVVNSAVANAEHNLGADIEQLKVGKVFVDEGLKYKRVNPRAKGRANRVVKRCCHITVELTDIK